MPKERKIKVDTKMIFECLCLNRIKFYTFNQLKIMIDITFKIAITKTAIL